MRALVTGGAEFIGHHLVRGLLERGDRVSASDDHASGFRSHLDFASFDDVVAALVAALPTIASSITCNVATGSCYTPIELLNAICEAAGRDVDPILGHPREGDILAFRADLTPAEQALGDRATAPITDGIARTEHWPRGMVQA